MEAVANIASISNGSACTSGATTCSHVLGAMGMAGQRAEGAIRLSWCHTTPEPDWPGFVQAIQQLRVATAGER